MCRLIRVALFLALIHYCMGNCLEKAKRCEKTFADEMKAVKFTEADSIYHSIYYNICGEDGIYNRLVTCVRQLQGQCDNTPQFRQGICHNRALKMNTYRYTWKFNLINDICYRTSPTLDAEFFKHEKCIGKILNTPRWKCDETHYKLVKATNGPSSCPHWRDFRKCTYDEVALLCGVGAANASDYLFHTHSSYFTKYTTCNLEGENYTKCWYDFLLERSGPSTAASSHVVSSTQLSETSEWVEEESRSSPPPKQQHTTYMSVQSSDYSTVESSEYSKEQGGSSSATTDSGDSYNKKDNAVDNDDTSPYNVEDNSISHHEEKHQEEEKEEHDDEDKEPADRESDHGDRALNEAEEEKKKTRKDAAHTEQVDPTVPSVSKELYQNDADLKSNNDSTHEATSAKSLPMVQDNKTSPATDASHKQINLAGASVVSQPELGQNRAGNSASAIILSPLLASLLSLLMLLALSS